MGERKGRRGAREVHGEKRREGEWEGRKLVGRGEAHMWKGGGNIGDREGEVRTRGKKDWEICPWEGRRERGSRKGGGERGREREREEGCP